ncbi:MAG: class I SAM-dependent methyltransferase [Anaerolineales bacterium]
MNHKVTVRNGYNAIAERYLAGRTTDSDDVRLLDDFVRRLPPDARILDAGCGAGVPVTRFLSRSHRVVGVDFAEAQIRMARRLVPGARFACQDLAKLGFLDGTFDGICSYYAIIHIPRREHDAILHHFYRMLKPSGVVLLCLGAEDLEEDIVENYLGTRMYWSHYDAETNLRLIRGCGFNLVGSQIVADATAPGSGHLFALAQK